MIDDFNKSKEEQRQEFEEIISTRADKNCQLCWGRGFQGWSEEYKRYVPCICVHRNVEKEVNAMDISDAEKGGILIKLGQFLGLN